MPVWDWASEFHMYWLSFHPYLPKSPWVLSPHEVELTSHGKQKSSQVSHRKVEEVDVGGRPHVLIFYNDQTSCHISEDTKDEENSGGLKYR